VITAGPFVPELLAPNDAAVVAPGDLELRWAPTPGAGSYLVTLATADSFSAGSIFAQYTVDADTGLLADTAGMAFDQPFYWRVTAMTPGGRSGVPSSMRQFRIRQVQITDVTFVGDDSAGVPDPVQTTVAFRYATIDFTQVRIGDGAVVAQWAAEMDSTDYFDLQEIIATYELLGQADITVGALVCTGWSGLSISMTEDGTPYGFEIAPPVCEPAEWPTGVSDLVTLKNDLVAKYRP
jgi:hypothetical protein